MPTLARACSECPRSLEGRPPQTKTCSNKCRVARSKRIRGQNNRMEEYAEQNHAGVQEIAAIVRREAPDVVTRVMKDELKPIVREALTEDVLQAINKMVGLTPKAVEALEEDLGSEDAVIRQRAYTLMLKYTVGHPALVQADGMDSGGQMVVNFNLPRPDAPATDAEPQDVIEVRQCDMCGEPKPDDEFVAGSGRCTECFEEAKAKVLAAFA